MGGKQMKSNYGKILLRIVSFSVFLLMGAIIYLLVSHSLPALKHFGLFEFLSHSEWDPRFGAEKYGALTFIVGSLATSLIALCLCIPFALSISVFTMVYFQGHALSRWMQAIIVILANMPGIIYGIWGYHFVAPILESFHLGTHGLGILTAGVVLAFMITPFASSLCSSYFKRIPDIQREAAYCLGATRCEVIRKIYYPYIKKGLIGSFMLSFAKLLGEAIAVTMLIGNTNNFPSSLTDTGNTMASIIVDQIATGGNLKFSALIAIGLLLVMITLTINFFAYRLMRRPMP